MQRDLTTDNFLKYAWFILNRAFTLFLPWGKEQRKTSLAEAYASLFFSSFPECSEHGSCILLSALIESKSKWYNFQEPLVSGRVSVNVANFAMLPESKKGRIFGYLVYYQK